jgi:glutamine amidotransferase
VGAFSECVAGLRGIGGDELIADWVGAGRGLLGICVGHQVLFASGNEHGVETAGLGLLPGSVEQLPASRLPHMGWNTLRVSEGSTLFAGVGDQRFYFVHSYAVLTGFEGAAISEHEGVEFVAAAQVGPICSTQFHPEKSGAAGSRLLSNWLSQCE